MADLHAAASADPQFPRVVLVHQGSPETGEALLQALWPEVRAIADPDRRIFRGLGLERASLARLLLRPRAWKDTLRAMRKGHGIGRPRGGDVRQMPGAFLIQDGRVLWEHPFTGGAGDLPVWGEVAALARAGA